MNTITSRRNCSGRKGTTAHRLSWRSRYADQRTENVATVTRAQTAYPRVKAEDVTAGETAFSRARPLLILVAVCTAITVGTLTWIHVSAAAEIHGNALTTLESEMLSWQGTHYAAEPDDDRAARILMTAGVIEELRPVKFPRVDAIALVSTAIRFESALDYYVHGGEPSPIGRQDGGGR
jgi:hypothetical protein